MAMTQEDINRLAEFFRLLIKIDRQKAIVTLSPTSDKSNYRK